MKNSILSKVVVVALLFVSGQASAQSWLKKALKTVENTAEAVSNVAESADSTASAAQEGKSIDWDSIPVYSAQKVVITDAEGNPVLNEDGTEQYRIFLVDQFGNKRSKEAVKEQQSTVKKALGNIVAKVGIGAGLGALSNKGEGALTGAIAGLALSADDIVKAKEHLKSLKQQKKLLEQYSENFTDEGVPVNASVDLSKLEDLNLSDTAISASADDIKKELESADFSKTATGTSLDDIEF